MYAMYSDFRIVYCNNYFFFFLISDKRHRDDEYVAILDLHEILKTFLDVCYC